MARDHSARRTASTPVLLVATCVFACPAHATDVAATGVMSVERLTSTAVRLRKVAVPDEGFKTGIFRWDPVLNAYKLSGALSSDDAYFADIQLWRKFETQSVAQSEKLTVFAGGLGVQSVQFRSPAGSVYNSICRSDGSALGMTSFVCEIENLPVGQTQFGNGQYLVTYFLAAGGSVARSYYLSGAYPLLLGITYPTQGSTNVSTTPTMRWRAIGAARYDFIIRNLSSGETVYSRGINNSIDTSLVAAVPAGALLPGTAYALTIEALGAWVNGAARGYKKVVVFTTAP